jgi:predicted deacylase
VRNVLAHLGVLPEYPPPALPAVRTRFTRNWGFPGRMEAPERGVFVPRHDLWDEVEAGAPAGQLHFPEQPGRAPLAVRYPAGGLIAARRAHGGVEQGTVLYWIVQDTE